MLNKALLIIFSLVLFGCAQTGIKNRKKPLVPQKHLSQEEIKDLNEQALIKVSGKLERLSVAAKASGPDKVRFLASDMYLKASAALMEGDYQTANLIFKHLVKLEPNDDFIQQKYAVSLIRTAELDKAEIILGKLFKNSKFKNSNIGLVLAGVYSSQGKTSKSRTVYSKLLAINSKNEEACIFLGKSYAGEGKIALAVGTLKGCEARDLVKKGKKWKHKAIYSYYIGKTYVDQKKFALAKKYFLKSAKNDPSFAQAALALGVVYEESNQEEKAKKTYVKFLKKNVDHTLILSRLVELLFSQEKFKEVIPYAERLSDHEPDNLNLKVKLGILYTDIKHYDKAVRTFKDLLIFAPNNDKILYYLGAIYQETNSYEDAIKNFAKVSSESGLYQDSSLQIVQMLSSLAKLEAKQQGFRDENKFHKKLLSFIDERVKKIHSFGVDFNVIKASYFETFEKNDRAISSLESVKSEKSFNNDHRFYLASLYEKEGEVKKSIELIEEVIEVDPKNAHAWNFLGYSMLDRGEDSDKAYEYILKAVTLNPKDGYIRDSLGWYFFKVGNNKKALSELKQAVKSVPDDIAINKHLAIVYTAMKDFKKAKFYVKKALAYARSKNEIQELNTVLRDLEQRRVPASFTDEIK